MNQLLPDCDQTSYEWPADLRRVINNKGVSNISNDSSTSSILGALSKIMYLCTGLVVGGVAVWYYNKTHTTSTKVRSSVRIELPTKLTIEDYDIIDSTDTHETKEEFIDNKNNRVNHKGNYVDWPTCPICLDPMIISVIMPDDCQSVHEHCIRAYYLQCAQINSPVSPVTRTKITTDRLVPNTMMNSIARDLIKNTTTFDKYILSLKDQLPESDVFDEILDYQTCCQRITRIIGPEYMTKYVLMRIQHIMKNRAYHMDGSDKTESEVVRLLSTKFIDLNSVDQTDSILRAARENNFELVVRKLLNNRSHVSTQIRDTI